MEPAKKLQVDALHVEIYHTVDDMAAGVSKQIHEFFKKKFEDRESLAGIMATGNSQIPHIQRLAEAEGIEWNRITLFHMDEYLGLPKEHPASFRKYLKDRVEDLVQPKQFHYLNGDADEPLDECDRYEALLKAQPIDFCCLGIGENGHIAFNDPHVANFDDPRWVKIVSLDKACRLQQVNEGHFPDLHSVPSYALTLTVPALCAASRMFCVAPEQRKAEAVKAALTGPVHPSCPASWLRTQNHATLYLDSESASLLEI